MIDLRETPLPDEPRITSLPMSALDRSWLEHVDPARLLARDQRPSLTPLTFTS